MWHRRLEMLEQRRLAHPSLAGNQHHAPITDRRRVGVLAKRGQRMLSLQQRHTGSVAPAKVLRNACRGWSARSAARLSGTSDRFLGAQLQVDRAVEPVLVAFGGPAALLDEPVEQDRIVVHPDDVDGIADAESAAQATVLGEVAHEGAGPGEPLGVSGLEQLLGLWVGPGRGDQRPGQARYAFGNLTHHRRPGPDDQVWVRLLESLLNDRPPYQGDRLVVADDRPIDGELEDVGLPAGGGEHGLAADARRCGDLL